ncbi:MAG: AzlD domain-containing protein [Lachnospiraceae bacterium]|nr:AzlD domain-containing protein [Lachnospiraceae bacterium]
MKIYCYIALMAITTYLIRVIPLVLFQKEIHSPFVKSFLYYVPYACLTAMTIPAIFTATQSPVSAACGFVVAVLLGWNKKSLPVVAGFACIAVMIAEAVLRHI